MSASTFVKRALVVAVVAAIGLAGCSDDDDGGTAFGGGEEQDQGAPENATGDGADGGEYTESSYENFLAVCTSYEGASQGLCECAFEEVASAVPYPDYQVFESEVLESGPPPLEDLPGFVVTAVTSCQESVS